MKWILGHEWPRSPSAGGGIPVMSKFVWILLPVALAASAASAEIYKCQAKNGSALYQNFPCPIDSLGSLPTLPQTAKTASTPASASQPNAGIAMPVEVAAAARSTTAAEPRVGMTTDEVRALWGEPVEIIQDEPVTGRVDIWQYGDGRAVQFNHKHLVFSVQR
jgi:hypothetical protein